MNFIEEFKTVQARDSVCSGRLSHVAISPTRIFNLGVMPSRVQSMRQEERHHQGVSGDVINDPFASVNTVSTFLEEFLILQKMLRMVTRCSRRENQLSDFYTAEIRFQKRTTQYAQREVLGDLWRNVIKTGTCLQLRNTHKSRQPGIPTKSNG